MAVVLLVGLRSRRELIGWLLLILRILVELMVLILSHWVLMVDWRLNLVLLLGLRLALDLVLLLRPLHLVLRELRLNHLHLKLLIWDRSILIILEYSSNT